MTGVAEKYAGKCPEPLPRESRRGYFVGVFPPPCLKRWSLKMISKRLRLAAALLALAFTQAPSAQEVPPGQNEQPSQTAEEKEAARKELERKAVEMLDGLIIDARALRIPENRVRVLTSAADLLWPRDEKRARALFRDAAAAVNEAAGVNKSGDEEKRDRARSSVYMLRDELVRTAARRDPQLALELLRATRQAPPTTEPGPGYMELGLETKLAAQVSARDPKRALQMAEENLARGLTFETVELLGRLQAADAEAGQKFAAEMVKKVRSESLSRNQTALFVAARLLDLTKEPRRARIALVSGAGPDASEGLSKPPVLDAQTLRDLRDVLLTAALKDGSDDYVLSVVGGEMQEIEKQWPERAALLKEQLAARRKRMSPEEREWSRYAPLYQQESPEPLLEAAADAPPSLRYGLYTSAAWKAAGAGDFGRARQIIDEHIQDSSQRAQLLDQIESMSLQYSLREGKVEDALRLVSQVRSKEKRAGMLAGLAVLAATQGNTKAAQQLLEEARPLAGQTPRNLEQVQVHLQLARAYALVEPPRAFEIIENVIDRANEMIAAADVLDGFMPGPEIFRHGELVMHSGMVSLDSIFEMYGRELSALARADFDRANAAAARFQRQEVRTFARLLIAQGLLSDRKPSKLTPEMIMGGGAMTVMRGR